MSFLVHWNSLNSPWNQLLVESAGKDPVSGHFKLSDAGRENAAGIQKFRKGGDGTLFPV